MEIVTVNLGSCLIDLRYWIDQGDAESIDDTSRDLILDREDIAHLAIVIF